MILQLILIQVATLIVIVFILRQIFIRHVNSALANLRSLYQDNLKKEDVLNDEISHTKKLRHQEIARAKQEADQIRLEAKQAAEEESKKLISDAQNQAEAQASRILEKANLQVDSQYRRMVQSLQEEVANFSEDAINCILSQKSKRILQEQLIKELLQELKGAPKDQVEMEEGTNEIGVTCAYALGDSEKKQIREAVCQYLGKEKLNFSFNIDQALIGGLILNFGGKIIDGGLYNRLRQAFSKIEPRHNLQFKPQQG